jgi:hypothetical protein
MLTATIDGTQFVYCHRAARASQLAGEEEEFERGDCQVGSTQCRGMVFLNFLL